MSPFVPNGESRRDTAILLTGTAEEFGLSKRDIKVVGSGFHITDELAEHLGLDLDAPEGEPVEVDPDADPDDEEDDVPPYEEWEYADLKTEVSTRGIETEDQKKDTLVAALRADDEAQAEAE